MEHNWNDFNMNIPMKKKVNIDFNMNIQVLDISILNSTYKYLSIRVNLDILINHLISKEIMSYEDCEEIESIGAGKLEKDHVFSWIQNYLQNNSQEKRCTCLQTILNAINDDEFIK